MNEELIARLDEAVRTEQPSPALQKEAEEAIANNEIRLIKLRTLDKIETLRSEVQAEKPSKFLASICMAGFFVAIFEAIKYFFRKK